MRTNGRVRFPGALAAALALEGCRSASPVTPPAAAAISPEPPEPDSADAPRRTASAVAQPPATNTRGQAHREGIAGKGRTSEEAELREQFADARVLSVLHGKAAYYADKFTGRKTASGERYDPKRFTAAHRRLPFGSVVRVTRKDGGQQTFVRINDRGPYGDSRRIIDLAKVAADRLDMTRAGVADVRVEVLRLGGGEPPPES